MTKSGHTSKDNLLAQATCAVLRDGQPIGTAWLVSDEGYLLTAGHVLGEETPLSEVKVQFGDDIPRTATQILWYLQEEMKLDFAVLKLIDTPTDCQPLPISLARSVTGAFKLYGYGKSLKELTGGEGKFVSLYGPERKRLFRLSSKELAEEGFSGGAVYSEELGAVVAIQIEAGKARLGPTSETVLAMPLYRMAQFWKHLEHLARIAESSQAPHREEAIPNVSDLYTPYEIGMARLLKRVQNHPRHSDALVYQQQLAENIARTRRYGDTQTRRAERAEIIDRLNGLALAVLGVSFRDLSQVD